jgi:transcriptional regulator with AAA-type ATPase domain
VTILEGRDRAAAEAISSLCYVNPFLAERVSLEAQALGAEYRHVQHVWTRRHGEDNPNVVPLGRLTERLLGAARTRLGSVGAASERDAALYLDLVRFHLFHRFEDDLMTLAYEAIASGGGAGKVAFYEAFAREAEAWLSGSPRLPALPGRIEHLFACVFQVRRAFALVHEHILGISPAAVALRAATWESVFTHDMALYQRTLYQRMHDVTTLIVGPSGTGKELVARAIGLSRYVPFDPRVQRFKHDRPGSFAAVNVAALAASVVESELFGHRRGSFTGAVQDKPGWLETTPAYGALFLDEIGELDPLIQAKLLRVLQTREFQRVGDTESRRFEGKLVAATNRDLAREMRTGRFREDFYYRLCADVVRTPSLQEQLRDQPEDLRAFVENILRRLMLAGGNAQLAASTSFRDSEEGTVERVAVDVVAWIRGHLGDDYAWPGNVRELEQCVRSVIVRRGYRPAAAAPNEPGVRERIGAAVAAGRMTFDEVFDAYCTLVYAQTGSFKEAARRMGIDRRTVKARLNAKLLAELNAPEV